MSTDRQHHLTPVDEPPFDPDYDHNTPNQDHAAEQATLGAMLLDNTQIPTVADLITPDDYYRPAHSTIHQALVTLHATGQHQHIDAVVLATHLATTGDLIRIGGAPYLHQLTTPEACPHPANAPGYATAIRDAARARTLYDVGTRLRQLGTKGYTADLEAAYDHAYETLDKAAANYGPAATPANTGLADLSWILTGQPPTVEPPQVLQRADGVSLFYRGKINGLIGDPEHGKTWIAQAAIVEELNNGGTAAMIDVDHNGMNHTTARLLLLGAHPNTLADPTRWRYYEPEDADQLRNACRDLTIQRTGTAVVDSIGEVLAMFGANPNDETEVTNAFRATLVPLAASGSTVITVDHLPKGADARASGYAIGSIAKKRMTRGSYLRVDARTKPAPGQAGYLTLRVEKDTSGELRRNSGGGYAGTFVLDSRDPRVTTWQITTNDNPTTPDGTFRPTHVMERVSRFVEDNDRCNTRAIRDHVGGKGSVVKAAVETLVAEGYIVTMAGTRGSVLHHSVIHYRELDDTNETPS